MTASAIKNLQTTHPRGWPIGTADLRRLGISPALAHEYVASGWLERLGRGVFMFAGDTLGRDACLCFLQAKVAGLHVAGRTALDWQGFRQNVALREVLCLHGSAKAVLPEWFTQRFPARYSRACVFDAKLRAAEGLTVLPEGVLGERGPAVSAPERALLEMLSEVGVQQEAAEARGIMETVRHLRVKELGRLLRHCRAVKTVRLCVLWAEELGLPWAAEARKAAANRWGQGRWVRRLDDGQTLILKN